MVTIVDLGDRQTQEASVLGALLDSASAPYRRATAGMRTEVLLIDHYVALPQRSIRDIAAWVRDSVPEAPRDLTADFVRVAEDSSQITPFALPRDDLHLIADSTFARFFLASPGDTLGWTKFRDAFPNARAVFSISRAGMSKDGRWAIVYTAQQSGWLAGAGNFVILHLSDTTWEVRQVRGVWFS